MGQLVHLFWTSVDPSLACASWFVRNGFLRLTSGVTPADLLVASITAEQLWPNFIERLDKSDELLLLLKLGSVLTKRVVKDCLHNPHQALLVSISNSTTGTQELENWFLLRLYIWHHMKNYKSWNFYFCPRTKFLILNRILTILGNFSVDKIFLKIALNLQGLNLK